MESQVASHELQHSSAQADKQSTSVNKPIKPTDISTTRTRTTNKPKKRKLSQLQEQACQQDAKHEDPPEPVGGGGSWPEEEDSVMEVEADESFDEEQELQEELGYAVEDLLDLALVDYTVLV